MTLAEEQLVNALTRLSKSIERNTELTERLLEIIPATKEAELLGVSAQTIRAKRKERKAERLLS